jgi:hypothetical protein
MLVQIGTSINEAVDFALNDNDLLIDEGIDYSEVNYSQYAPEEIHDPGKDGDPAYAFYEITVYTNKGPLTGYAIKDTTRSYGKPVSIELYDDEL